MNGLNIRSLLGLTLRSPAQAAGQILAADLPIAARWALGALVVTLAAILAAIATSMIPVSGDETQISTYEWVTRQPLILAGLQFCGLVLSAALMSGVGRIFGGEGRFEDALILAVWVEAIALMIQALQILLLPIAPDLSIMLSLAAAGMFFYLTVQFTKVLHGFRSGWKVFFVMLGTMLAMGFLLSFIAAAFGLMPQIPEVPA